MARAADVPRRALYISGRGLDDSRGTRRPGGRMNLRVLGCSGGSARGRLPTSFLVDGTIAIDGGAVTASLAPHEQERIDHVVLSHAHLDHIANLPFLLDNRFARQTRPITLWAPEATLCALKTDVFNNRVWPDFTALSNS